MTSANRKKRNAPFTSVVINYPELKSSPMIQVRLKGFFGLDDSQREGGGGGFAVDFVILD